MSLINVPCAVCGGTDFTLIYPATIADPAADPALYYSSSRAQAGHLDIVRCTHCGLLLTNPRDDDETLAQVYAALQDATYDREDHNRRRTAQIFLDLIAQYHAPARLLDVGCATGLFVSVAQQAGWQVTGLEVSSWAVAQAQKRCPQANYVVGLLEEIDFPAGSFDAVTLWDVLEHVPSPAEALLRVRRWLKPDGWLFLNLPDAGSHSARWLGRRWVLLLREHLWYFDSATIAQLLQHNDFELICTKANWVHFSLKNVLMRLAQYPGLIGRVAVGLARLRIGQRINIRFPMGEMQVVARRRLQ